MCLQKRQKGHCNFVYNPKDLKCWLYDVITFDIDIEKTSPREKSIGYAHLGYTNAVKAEMQPFDDLIVPFEPAKKKQILYIPVRGIPLWSFGDSCHKIELLFPKGCEVKIDRAYLTRLGDQSPQLTMNGFNYNPNIGQFVLNANYLAAQINYDARAIKNCKGIALEVIGPGQYFTQLNSQQSNQYSLVGLLTPNPHGQLILTRSLFPGDGLYKSRLRPIDRNGNQIGYCSDHFVVSVTK